MIYSYILRYQSSYITSKMAPPNQPAPQTDPNQPPKREINPISVPTVGLGKDQVYNSLN